MTVRIKGTDTVLVGTKEVLYGVAEVAGINEDGSIEYAGSTEIDWDSQVPVQAEGKKIWVTEDDQEVVLSRDEIETVE
ncbi:hypothetical protein [Thioalkalivibrio sp. ALE19]|uniref:hypothetical protein n=1 Tax=Thioalkalivibrio sp. ALE19 TaxID=1266909 RepID=UPI000424F8CF|nr:hypothetical protein [Thioalkalivibrio sp. ALE19]